MSLKSLPEKVAWIFWAQERAKEGMKLGRQELIAQRGFRVLPRGCVRGVSTTATRSAPSPMPATSSASPTGYRVASMTGKTTPEPWLGYAAALIVLNRWRGKDPEERSPANTPRPT
jgi:hypothetical protein